MSEKKAITDWHQAVRVLAEDESWSGDGTDLRVMIRRHLRDGTLVVYGPDPDEDAKAIATIFQREFYREDHRWENTPEGAREQWRAVARAARERFAGKEAR